MTAAIFRQTEVTLGPLGPGPSLPPGFLPGSIPLGLPLVPLVPGPSLPPVFPPWIPPGPSFLPWSPLPAQGKYNYTSWTANYHYMCRHENVETWPSYSIQATTTYLCKGTAPTWQRVQHRYLCIRVNQTTGNSKRNSYKSSTWCGRLIAREPWCH